MNDEVLRKKVRLLKATEAITNYYELSELLEMTEKSFYNWLAGYYSLGYQKKQTLKRIVEDLYIPQ
jgi:hypothetical protein